jgi:LysM repeat protein
MFAMDAFKRFTHVFLFLLLALGMLGLNVQAAFAQVEDCTEYYTVRRGDYLVKIAREFGVSWRTLAEINDLADPTRIYPGQRLCISTSGDVNEPTIPDTGSNGQVWADRVVEDRYATIEASGLAANSRYIVLYARKGQAVDSAVRVGSVTTNRNGAFAATFNLPKKLVDVRQISVFVMGGGRVLAQNWFYNETASGDTGGDDGDNASDDLTIQVVRVVEDEEVTIQARNFPTRTVFKVWMADRDARRLKWIEVINVETGRSSSFEEDFEIPEELWGVERINVLFESADGEFDASTWFTNADREAGVPDFPFLTPIEVVRNESVTIRFTNLPAGVEYDVLMGKIGTKGVDGVFVGTARSAQGGTVVRTYDIPASLRGSATIAIRMEAPSRGPNAFAYNWFTNQTSP